MNIDNISYLKNELFSLFLAKKAHFFGVRSTQTLVEIYNTSLNLLGPTGNQPVLSPLAVHSTTDYVSQIDCLQNC